LSLRSAPAKDGKPEQRYGIDVIFSLHCFSRGIAAGAVYLADLAYADSREVRLFAEQRYTHSLRLPEVQEATQAEEADSMP
jgi:hypothetical protein